jgi:hypothetical protein
MDKRQTEITQGKGLQESRINQDFVDFLNKWSTPVLLLLVLVAGGIWAKRMWDERRVAKVNAAFASYEAALGAGNPNPESLRRVAEEFPGVRGVPGMARLTTADLYLSAATTGLKPGAELDGEGRAVNADDVLDDAARLRYLEDAGRLYEQVLADAEAADQTLLAIGAAFGSGAVKVSRGDADGARGMYERAAALAEEGRYPILAGIARERAAGVGSVAARSPLPSSASLPALQIEAGTSVVPGEPETPTLESPGGLGLDPSSLFDPAEDAAGEGSPAEQPETP